MRNTIVVAFAATILAASDACGESLCFGPSNLGVNGTVDCDPVSPTFHANSWRGYSTNGAEACTAGDCNSEALSYGWSVSLSETDPDQNQGPLSETLYLWLDCAWVGGGIWGAEFGLQGTLDVISFEPLNGFTNIGSATNLLLLAPEGCSHESLVGRITVDASVSVENESWGRTKSMYRF